MAPHSDRPLRVATISMGWVAGALVVPAFVIGPAYFPEVGIDLDDVYEGVLFRAPAVWFICNALRWMQDRLVRPDGWIPYATISVLVCLGGTARVAATVDEFNRGWERAVYGFGTAGSLFVLAAAPMLSAVWFLLAKPTHGGHWLGGRGPGSARIAEISVRSAGWLRFGRWLAIAGGVLFALSIFVSPTVIPIAVALTCLVRYVATMSATANVRLASAIGVSVLLVAIQVRFVFDLAPADAVLGWIGGASAVVMIAALVVSLMNRRMSDDLSSVGVTAS